MSKHVTFVLIHGAWHTATCWRPIVEGLSAGCDAVAVDLPDSGPAPLFPLGYSPRTADFPSSPALNTQHTQKQRTETVVKERAGVEILE